MGQVDRTVSKEDTLSRKCPLHGNCQHLLISGMNVEPLVATHVELAAIHPDGNMLKLESLLQ